MRMLVLGLLLVSLMVSGCVIFGQQEQVANNTTAPPPPPPPPKPVSFAIASPGAGEVMVVPGNTSDVTLTLTTQNLVLKSPGGAKKAGEGYFKVTVDDKPEESVTTKTFLISGLALGNHTIKVELFSNDRTSYTGVQPKEVMFTIEKEKPTEYVPQEYKVNMKDFTFEPATVNARVSDRITFTNTGAFPRDATCFVGPKQEFDTKVLQPGKSATITVTEPFECDFYSSLHRAMVGHMKVIPNGMENQ